MVVFVRTGRVAGGWLLLSLAACGGRTGELEGYQPDTGSSLPSDGGTSGAGQGATSGSSSSGASTSTGASTSRGGAAGAGQAGAPSKGGAPGTAGSAASGGFGEAGAATGGSASTGGSVTVACSELCLDPQTACPGQFGPPGQCWNDCVTALNVNDSACASVGVDLVFCVKSAAEKYGKDCSTGASQAPLQCAGLLNSYQACASAAGGPTPVPPPASCTGGGSAGPGKCYQNQTCSDGTYFSVTCYQQDPNQSACTCTTGTATGTATTDITLNESAVYACNDASIACNGGILPK